MNVVPKKYFFIIYINKTNKSLWPKNCFSVDPKNAFIYCQLKIFSETQFCTNGYFFTFLYYLKISCSIPYTYQRTCYYLWFYKKKLFLSHKFGIKILGWDWLFNLWKSQYLCGKAPHAQIMKMTQEKYGKTQKCWLEYL